jgi:dTDP-4-amino-4,6-dideoxygalactose transaminase
MASQTSMAAIPLLDLKAQYATIRDDIQDTLQRVVESQCFILGPEVQALEEEIAAYCGCDYGVGVSSGSDALLVALMAIDLKPGDEVITTPYTFFATAGAVARLGGKPVFVDIDPLTFNIDPVGIEAAISPRTRAIIPVHLYGQMAEMDPIMDLAAHHRLAVIEDAAQAIGAEYQGHRAGSLGLMTCFSFFPSKNLGGFGDGGMVTTNDAALDDRLRLLRNHGHRPKYYNREVGGNFRLDALQAAVLRVKLKHLDRWTTGRQRNADTYRGLLTTAGVMAVPEKVECLSEGCQTATCALDRVVLPPALPDRRHIYNQFVIRAPRRDELKAYLKEHHIGSEIYYPVPLHLQECFVHLGGAPGDHPASECAAHTSLALPIYPELTEDMQRTVVDAIQAFYSIP